MTAAESKNLEAQRHTEQRAFIASGANIEVGDKDTLPWRVEALKALRGDEPEVRDRFDTGLTAVVYRLHGAGRDWTLKRARANPLVQNFDGQTSFLNEVQCRADLERLKQQPGGTERWSSIVDTAYASLHDGIILSPWIEGLPVVD